MWRMRKGFKLEIKINGINYEFCFNLVVLCYFHVQVLLAIHDI